MEKEAGGTEMEVVDGSGCLNTKGGGCGPTPAGCKLEELNVFLDRPSEFPRHNSIRKQGTKT